MKKLFIPLILVIGIGVGLYFGYADKYRSAQIISDKEESSVEEKETQIESDDVFRQAITYSSLNELYSGQSFSFKYPDGFEVTHDVISSGEIFTVENSKGSGFQIFYMAWDELDPITPERIWQDMPDADVLEPKNAELDGVKTLVFYGYNEDMGETFEAWAVYKKRLYQITGPKVSEKLIIETLETWNWK